MLLTAGHGAADAVHYAIDPVHSILDVRYLCAHRVVERPAFVSGRLDGTQSALCVLDEHQHGVDLCIHYLDIKRKGVYLAFD